jgi:hypothetical protein
MSIKGRLAALEKAASQRRQEPPCCRCLVCVGEEDHEPDEHGCCRKCGLERRGQHIVVVEEIVTAPEQESPQ